MNDSNLGAEPIHIENCTLNEFEDHDVKDMSCYDVGFHPIVVIAMLSSFINVGTLLLFAFISRFHVFWGEKYLVKMDENNRIHIHRGGDDKFTYTFKVTMMVIYCLSMGIQFAISFPLLILLVINYFGIPSVDKNSFQKIFSNETFVGQGIGLCCVHFLFLLFPYSYIENYHIQEV